MRSFFSIILLIHRNAVLGGENGKHFSSRFKSRLCCERGCMFSRWTYYHAKRNEITKHRIQVLGAFLIKEIRVQERTSLSNPEEEINELYESIEKYNTFVDQYKKAIEEYKKIFQG